MKKQTRRTLKHALWGTAACATLVALVPISGAVSVRASVVQAGQIMPQVTHETALPSDVQVLFSDAMNQGENLLSAVLDAINGAETSIDMVMYSFEHPVVHAALNAAVDRGVRVRVITDGNALDKTTSRLRDAQYAITAAASANEAHMHHKYLIVDTNTALVGSLNLTQLQVKHDPSMLLVTHDPAWIETLNAETDRLARNRAGRRKFRSSTYAPLSAETQSADGVTQLWLSPGVKRNSVKEHMLDLIETAEEQIDIVMWQWTDRDLARAVLARAADGVAVRIISDDRYLWNSDSAVKYIWEKADAATRARISIISDFGATLDYRTANPQEPYFNPYIHAHTLLVDRRVVVSGTANWSFRGFFRNDEAQMVSTVPSIVGAFVQDFEHQYATFTGSANTAGAAFTYYPLTPDMQQYTASCALADCPTDVPLHVVVTQQGVVVGQQVAMPQT